MTWQELIRQTNSNNDSELVWSTTEAQLAEADRELLKAFADELVKRLQPMTFPVAPQDSSAGAVGERDLRNIIRELLTEAGVER